MKKITLALSLVLGLFSISATQAQMRIYNSNLVKFGNVNTSPTLSKGLEVAMDNFLFKGSQVKFTIAGTTIETVSSSTSTNSLSVDDGMASPNVSGLNPPPIYNTPEPSVRILAPKNDLGLGKTAQPLHSVYATNLYGELSALSDRRYKTNIKDLTPTLDKIMRLRPVKFDYLEEKDNLNSLDSTRMNNVGLIAQELLEVVPEAVRYLFPDDIYMVSYTTLIPYLVKSIQEQQALIENQQTLIENQQLQIEDLQMTLLPDNAAFATPTFSNTRPNGNVTETVTAVGNKLWSNVPNPFKQETRIRYALTEDVRDAQLCIYDLSGKQLSCHRLNDRGESEFVLRAATLNPGIYLYSLIADGQVVDTHRMVVTE